MDKIYDQTKVEEKWYRFWEESGFFAPEINPQGKPYTIILPPPNANADLHFGHAMMSVEDILIRYHRMKGDSALWLPGSDHAGFETQVVFEKKLAEKGKSRFDFDRETLFQMIWDYVEENKKNMEGQLRRLGFSVDWSREKFTLDPEIVKIVYKTFKKMFDEGLIYRAYRLVNYCTKHQTGFSDLEVIYTERNDKLYFIKYPLSDGLGFITVATTRPETMFGDSAVAVNPKDTRFKGLSGKSVRLPFSDREIPIIEDSAVQMEFGTGVVKVTPAHDPLDFEIGARHNLEQITVIGFDGKLKENTGKFSNLSVEEARKKVIEELEALELIEKIEDYTHRVGTCYKCGKTIEPLLLDQWYVSIKPLAKRAIEVVKKGDIKFHPDNFTQIYLQWMENIRDWNIVRQNVWGIRVPAWYCKSCSSWIVTEGETPEECGSCKSKDIEQDRDVFDTWFSSSQWPFATLMSTKEGDYDKFYPTSVLETGRDLIFFWVSRMIMMGLYRTSKVPFKDVAIHGLVLDPLGKKMSKSKGNVVSPMEIVDQYGADAARMALVYGTAFSHDQALSHPKLQTMRNFTNKLWNIGRFIIEFKPEGYTDHPELAVPAGRQVSGSIEKMLKQVRDDNDKDILKELLDTAQKVTSSIEQYRFHDGADALYEFIWHEFANKYIESTKDRRSEAQPTLEYIFRTSLELLHPFMPFVTEEIWQRLPHEGKSIMLASWPKL